MAFRSPNRIGFNTATTGTGAAVVASAVTGLRTPAQASVADGQAWVQLITEGVDWEISYGAYTVASTSVSRILIESSTGSLLNLAGAAKVRVIGTAADMLGSMELSPAEITADQNNYNPTGFDRS